MDEQEMLHRMCLGDMLVLTIPRDDFAKLMDAVARLEQGQIVGDEGVEDLVDDLSRIASDLSQQADAQD